MQDYNKNITEVKMGDHLVTTKATAVINLKGWEAPTWLRQRLSEKDCNSTE